MRKPTHSTSTAPALRDYQQALTQGIYEKWRNHRRVMAQLPTGGGKTVVFSHIGHEFTSRGEGVLVLAHRQELITQAAAKLRAVADCPVGIVKAGHKPCYAAPIQVASVQSVARRLHHLRPPGLVIIDEAHHSTASTYRRILEAFPDAYQLGVSATPCRTDGSGFTGLFDALVTGPTVADLIDGGHLSRFRLFADPNPMATGGARTRQGDYSTSDVAELNPAVELSGNLIASYQAHCPGKRCIVFAINIEHSQTIAERYQAHGIPAAHLDGETSPEERAATLAAFARGELLVLSNVGLFTEGFDLPALDAVQVARPTKSLGLWLQMIGRALRPAPGKDYAILLDHTRNWAIHGLPTRPRRWSLDGVTSDPIEAKARDDGEVEEVQLVLNMPSEILENDTALAEVDISPEAEWERVWDDLLATQQARGYKPHWLAFQLAELQPPLAIWERCATVLGYRPGWAWHQYREHTLGEAPEPTPEPPKPPAPALPAPPDPALIHAEIWDAVVPIITPLGTRALMQQQGSLLFYDGVVARVGIGSRPLLRMAQGRIDNVGEAFRALGYPIDRVELVCTDPTLSPPSPPAVPPLTPRKMGHEPRQQQSLFDCLFNPD